MAKTDRTIRNCFYTKTEAATREHKYSFWDFHTVTMVVLKSTGCKEIHLSPLNWIFCEINMIKLLTYTRLLCFLLSFKKILPSWTTAPGHIWGQCRPDCCDNAAMEIRHNQCGLSDTVRLLVHVLKPQPAHPLRSTLNINYTMYCAVLLLHLHDYERLRYPVIQWYSTLVFYINIIPNTTKRRWSARDSFNNV